MGNPFLYFFSLIDDGQPLNTRVVPLQARMESLAKLMDKLLTENVLRVGTSQSVLPLWEIVSCNGPDRAVRTNQGRRIMFRPNMVNWAQSRLVN